MLNFSSTPLDCLIYLADDSGVALGEMVGDAWSKAVSALGDRTMAKNCGGKVGRGPRTVSVGGHRRSTPGSTCYGPGKPGPKTISVRPYRRSKP